jgi:hypothetical protein
MNVPNACFVLQYRSISKEGQVRRHASFVRYLSRSENKLFLSSDAQNISDLFNLEAYPASLIWPSFGNTTVVELTVASSGPSMLTDRTCLHHECLVSTLEYS